MEGELPEGLSFFSKRCIYIYKLSDFGEVLMANNNNEQSNCSILLICARTPFVLLASISCRLKALTWDVADGPC